MRRLYLITFGIVGILAGGGTWYYLNVTKPKQENIKKTKKIEELENNITLTSINLDIQINNALIKQEHNQTDKKIKEIKDENFTNIYDFNSSSFLNGLFIFNPQRKD